MNSKAGQPIPNRIFRLGLADILLLSALAAMTNYAILNINRDDNDYFQDEGAWVAVSKYTFHNAFVAPDWREATWDVEFGTFGRRNSNIGKLIMGAAMYASGAFDTDTPLMTGFPPDIRGEAISDFRPPKKALAAARAPMRFLGIVCAALLFIMTSRLVESRTTGFLAALLFIASPIFLESSRRAMLEIPATMFSFAALALIAWNIRWIRKVHKSPPMHICICFGALVGLALSTKLTSLMVIPTAALWWALAKEPIRPMRSWLRGRNTSTYQGLASAFHGVHFRPILTITAVAGIVFVASNPLLIHRPSMISRILLLGRKVAKYRVPIDQRIDSIAEGITSLLEFGLVQDAPLARWLCLPGIDAALAALGLVVCSLRVSRRTLGGDQGFGARAVLAWCGVTASLTVALVPFKWSRWYMPMEACWVTLEAIAVAACLSWLCARGSARLQMSPEHRRTSRHSRGR